MEKMEKEKIKCWNKTQKNEMETGDENCHITEREMVDKKLLNGTQNSDQNTGPTERLEDQGKDGKTISMNSSNKLRKRQKT